MSKEMNIEEAIEKLNNRIKTSNRFFEQFGEYAGIDKNVQEAIETVLADRERLQKENDRLKNINKIINKENLDDKYEEVLEKVMTKFLNNNIEKDYIPTSVIKEKILKPIQEEKRKAVDEFMKKNLDEDFITDGDVIQTLGHVEGLIQELLEKEK